MKDVQIVKNENCNPFVLNLLWKRETAPQTEESIDACVACRSETCAILKHVSDWHCVPFWICTIVPFWNMLQICTVQTSSYQSHILNARSRSIKTCASIPKVRPSYCICFALFCFVLLCFFFSVMKIGLPQMQWVKKTSLLSTLHMAKSEQRQSKACFKMAHFPEWHTMPIWNMFQEGTYFRTARNTCHRALLQSSMDPPRRSLSGTISWHRVLILKGQLHPKPKLPAKFEHVFALSQIY